MSDLQQLAKRYIDVWNETDGDRRRELIAELFTADSSYTDPLGAVQGLDGINAFIGGAQEQFSGMRFSLGSDVDAHHDIARFNWHLGPEGATEPMVIGFDVITADGDKVRTVHGFLDKLAG